MHSFDKNEYNTVILAALLHDIGKFLHRTKPGYAGKHQDASADFLKDENTYKISLENKLYDLPMLDWLTRHHHPRKGIRIDRVVNDYKQMDGARPISDKRLKNLLRIVRNADCYSCVERNPRKQQIKDAEGRRTALLTSIFSDVSLEDPQSTNLKYTLNDLDPLNTFPQNVSEFSDQDIKTHEEKFIFNFPDLNNYDDFDKMLYILLNHFENYLWCIPSDTRYERPDISLHDHLRTSGAIAACLYKRHCNDLENTRFRTRSNEFILIAGDFSGIQKYIIDITSRVATGAAKRLRARSFFISAFCETTIHKILHAIELPPVCNLFSAGGKFILLAPNTDEVDESLREVKLDIEREIYNGYFNQFTFLMTWKQIKKFRPDMNIRNFCTLADKMFHGLETEKVQPFNSLFCPKNNEWKNEYFSMPNKDFRLFAQKGDCKICGKRPGSIDLEGTESCEICEMNKSIGGVLAKRSSCLIGFTNESCSKSERQEIPLFSKTSKQEGYCLHLLDNEHGIENYYLGYNLNPKQSAKANIPGKYIANYVPTDESNSIIPFDRLAEKGSEWINPHDGNTYGNNMLGVLKADVDNLGLLFSKGFGEEDRRDKRTVSRFLTLSRMLELFFSGWVGQIMNKDKEGAKEDIRKALSDIENQEFLEDYLATNIIDFQNIYTVYSGGDDLILIGPWETMIVFALVLNANFRKYTCESDSFTLSAGLSFVKPKFPIASAMREANRLLIESKGADNLLKKFNETSKNRITLFNTTIEWSQLPYFVDVFLFFNDKLSYNNPRINPSFLYRLLEYRNIAKKFIEKDKIEGLRYISLLNYDIGKNIVRYKHDKVIENLTEVKTLENMFNLNFKNSASKRDIKNNVYLLNIPLEWLLYRYRKPFIF